MSGITMLFESNNPIVSIPASEILVKTAGFDIIDDKLCFVFATSEGKRGYGKQAIPVEDLQESYEALSKAAENGVRSDNYKPSTPEIIQQSLVMSSEDGSVRFKTQGEKGKKPTHFMSEKDFIGYEVSLKKNYDNSEIIFKKLVIPEKDLDCIKNSNSNNLYKIFPFWYESFTKLRSSKLELGTIKPVNPFIYGETSISNIVKRYPVKFIFKPLMFLITGVFSKKLKAPNVGVLGLESIKISD